MSKINLTPFGLNEKENVVYLALLELGEASISAIVNKSGVKRTTVYAVLRSLHECGLVSFFTKHKRTLYLAEDPRTLRKILSDKERKLEAVMPELLSLTNALTHKPVIRFFEGIKGIEQVYEDTLRFPDQEMVAWVTDEALKSLDNDFLYGYLPRRVAQKIWVRVLAPESPLIKNYVADDKKWLRQTRTVSKEHFPFGVEIDLYGRRNIAIMSFREQFGIVIESEEIYRTLRSIFEMGWRLAEGKVN